MKQESSEKILMSCLTNERENKEKLILSIVRDLLLNNSHYNDCNFSYSSNHLSIYRKNMFVEKTQILKYVDKSKNLEVDELINDLISNVSDNLIKALIDLDLIKINL